MPDDANSNKVGGFLKAETAGLPNWAWILVIAAGIAAAVVLPKFLGKKGSSSGETIEGSGLGLAVDPTNGLPYAVEGLVPSGAMAGTGGGPFAGSAQPIVSSTMSTPPVAAKKGPITRSIITQGWGTSTEKLPIRDAPGGNIISRVGYDTPIEFMSSKTVTGPNNFANAPQGVGSTQWYPVKGGGYISAFDINVGATGPSLSMAAWPYAHMTAHDLAIQRGVSDSKIIGINPEIDSDNAIYPGLRYNVQ